MPALQDTLMHKRLSLLRKEFKRKCGFASAVRACDDEDFQRLSHHCIK